MALLTELLFLICSLFITCRPYGTEAFARARVLLAATIRCVVFRNMTVPRGLVLFPIEYSCVFENSTAKGEEKEMLKIIENLL